MSQFPFFFAANELSVVVGPILARVAAGSLTKPTPWRPAEWDRKVALTAITVPAVAAGPAVASSTPGQPSAPAFKGSPAKVYAFDAVLKADHSRELRCTQHPIQTSASSPVASITDHAYREPARLVLEIGMSDAMQAYFPGTWSGSATKSISAYQTMVDLQKTRTLVTVSTRLDTYLNMVLEAIETSDSAKTLHGLRATLVFREINTASVTAVSSSVSFPTDDQAAQQASSSRPQLTKSTPLGTVQPAKPANSLLTQHQLTAKPTGFPSIPGAGLWSSLHISRVIGGLRG